MHSHGPVGTSRRRDGRCVAGATERRGVEELSGALPYVAGGRWFVGLAKEEGTVWQLLWVVSTMRGAWVISLRCWRPYGGPAVGLRIVTLSGFVISLGGEEHIGTAGWGRPKVQRGDWVDPLKQRSGLIRRPDTRTSPRQIRTPGRGAVCPSSPNLNPNSPILTKN